MRVAVAGRLKIVKTDLNRSQRLADLIAARYDWAGHFSVVEPGRVRMRVLT